jgi:phage terminase large subunit
MSAAVTGEVLYPLPADGWTARPYQQRFWHAMEKGCKRAVCVWHRRCGKDQCSINWTACASQERVGLYLHILPTAKQARKIVWEGMDNGGRPFLAAFPDSDNPGEGKFTVRKRDDEMKLWLANGSQWQAVGADDPDVALRGTNPVGVVLSEYATTPKMRAIWDNVLRAILTANGGWVVFIYTPRGKNHGHALYQMAKQNPDWFCEVLTVEDTFYEEAA